MSAPRFGLCCACVLALFGCNSQRPPPSPARFEQPNAVDFVCVRERRVKDDAGVTELIDNVRSLAACATPAPSTTDGIVPYAVVTQHARGEIAAINLEAHTVIDSRRDIPGYTFTAVGELPVAVIVPPTHPNFTYVADFASHDIRVLKTSALVLPLTTALGEAVLVQSVPLSLTTPQGSLALAPTHMLLAPDENALFVTIPEHGSVLWLPLQRCDENSPAGCKEGQVDVANIATIELAGSVDRIAPPTGRAPRNEYEQLCGFERTQPPPAEPITPPAEALARAALPAGMAVDAFCLGESKCPRRLLVADEALPLIHAIDIDKIAPGTHGSDALLAPIVTGVATRAVAVTPHVPKAVDSDAATQYVYAIDATDGSVLVTENGYVLNLDGPPAPRPNRIQFEQTLSIGPPAALGLSVLTPLYRTDIPVGQWIDPNGVTGKIAPTKCTDDDHEQETPARLRGVFLAVAMTDGTVRIVDVHDMELHVGQLNVKVKPGEAPKTGSCRPCPLDPIPVLIRHHERLASSFVVEAGEDIPRLTPNTVGFEFLAGALPFPVREDGTSGSPDATGLECFNCASGFTQVFPAPGSQGASAGEADAGVAGEQGGCAKDAPALLCAPQDPWTLSQEQWSAVYEGHLPATTGGDARFLDPSADPTANRPSPEVVASVDFCAAGVVGGDVADQVYSGEDCPAPRPPPGHDELAGDQLVITSTIPGDDRLDAFDLTGLTRGRPGRTARQDQQAGKKLCQEARVAQASDPTLAFALDIRRSYRDRLVIDGNLLHKVGNLRSYDQLRKCLGDEPMTFDVRARSSFVVIGSAHGFQHRIKAGADGRCVVDADADVLRRGRVRVGCTFRNQTIEWRSRKPGKDERVQEPLPGVQLAIQVVTPASKLRVNTSVLGFGGATVVPIQLRYNSVDRRLYLVDISDRGVVPITLDPLPPAVDTTATFN